MKLEVISRLPPPNKRARTPIIFVHGAFAGAWCWDEYFLPYFAKQGYPSYAVSLRGHGKSEGQETLLQTSLADYVSDVAQVTKQFEEPPIVVGHSMGGMVIQKYLETHPAAAVILMNSVPPTGLYVSSFYMAMSNPLLFQELFLIQIFGPQYANLMTMKRALFSNDISIDTVQKYFVHMQGESQRVVLDMLGLNLPCLWRQPRLPMLVLGASDDVFFPSIVVEWTARIYNAQHYTFPNMAHAMMLEKEWKKVADYMCVWLEKNVQPAKMPLAVVNA